MDAPSRDLTPYLAPTPLEYPGSPVAGPRLVVDDCAHPVRPHRSRSLGAARSAGCVLCQVPTGRGADSLDSTLLRLGAAPLDDRTPVLSIGSNSAAAVLRHKLRRSGTGSVVPLLTGVVRNLGVGHTAYVSRAGYVPAAPVHRHRARTSVVLALLDDDQLDAIDATEPGYDRVELTRTRYPLVLSGGLRPSRYHVYAAREGVLGLPGHRRRFLPQVDVLAALHDHDLPHTEAGEPAAIARRFAESAEHRAAVRDALAERGLTAESGLVHRPAGTLRWPDVVRTAARRRRVGHARRRRAR